VHRPNEIVSAADVQGCIDLFARYLEEAHTGTTRGKLANVDLADASVVVTGGTGGLGSRICHAFARHGARVAVVYLARHDAARALVEELRAAGAPDALAVQADVTQPEPVAAMVAQVIQAWGRLDVLVNDAAMNQPVAFADLDRLTLDLWQNILHTNVTGPFLCIKAVAPIMRQQARGRIVNVGSVAGFHPGGSSIAYAVSKAALAHLTRCMAVALAPHVLVNGVAPGLMEGTRMTANLDPAQVRSSLAGALLKRAVDKDDVAEQVVTFARTDSATGQHVVLDAGRFFH
jgi:3-oxoacyl-[acyl-carrier protein] reductase